MNIPTNSRVMHMAHALRKALPNETKSELLKLAWHMYYFLDMLRKGIVKFAFVKVEKLTGIKSLRHARGTLHPELIPEDKKPKGTSERKPNWGTMAYFDLDKMEWRSFSLPNLQDIEGYIALNEVDLSFTD